MPRVLFAAGNFDSTHVSEANITATLDDPGGGQEKMDNNEAAAFRIVYTSGGTNHWTTIKDSQWIRSARFRFYVDTIESANSYIVEIKTALALDPPENWNPRFMSWSWYGRNPGEEWTSVDGANATGLVGGEVLVGDIIGWKDAGVKSMLRHLMRIHEVAGTHTKVGFSLQAADETVSSSTNNLVQILDENFITKEPYMIVTYGQPTLSRMRSFGKRMLTRL